MEINGKFIRTIRKMLRAGKSVEAVANELCTQFRITDDEAYDAIEIARA
jgi:hypothetical protein